MEQKRYGVNISVLNELKQFQLSLRKKRRRMPFEGVAMVSYNNGPVLRHPIQATPGRICVGGFVILLTRNIAVVQGANDQITITMGDLEVVLFIIEFFFDSYDDQQSFVGALENPDKSSSSDSPSPEREM